jgi:ribonuclease Y
MSIKLFLIFAGISSLVGIGIGYYLRVLLSLSKKESLELRLKEAELQAETTAKNIILNAEVQASELLKGAREETKEREEKLSVLEDRLNKKEDFLHTKEVDLESESESLKRKAVELRELKDRVNTLEVRRREALKEVSGLSVEEAREALIKSVEESFQSDAFTRVQKIESQMRENIENKAKEILATTIQRLATSIPSDVFSTSIEITDDVKGKIIGKEGRNIKTLEKESGVEILVDEIPNHITISSFDPVRRAIARIAIDDLIADGRIQPARIEKAVEKAKEEVAKTIKARGEEAAREVGVFGLDPKLLAILGRLYFRSSYGQNVLLHSIEMAHLAGMIAAEIGANIDVAKTAALLHDIGKAIDHETQGTHVEIGRKILQKFNVDEAVIKAMQAHHEEYPFESVESIIVQVADSISGSRPGARRDNVENYLKRINDLEKVALGFAGVEKVYALQAGREIRIFVTPEVISDIEAFTIAKKIAQAIEERLRYPGEIKVVVLRETRAIEYAK